MRIKFQINSKSSILRGFTLIELLVVIAIISVLSALLLSNFVGIRQRGRDGQRKSDLEQIKAALELYRADNSIYPPELVCDASLASGDTVYMKKIPCDPISGEKYIYELSGFTYTLSACIENGADPKKDTGTGIVSTCPVASYTVTNP